jgi:hypothetical protein
LPNVIIEEFHAGKDGLIVFYNQGNGETEDLELSKADAAKLMERTGWVDDVDIYNDTVVLRFETLTDDINHHGNHVQRVYKMVMDWDEYRAWIVEREVRDIVRAYLKERTENGNH